MKKYFCLLLLTVSFDINASAEVYPFDGSDAQKLVTLLGGKTLVCVASDKAGNKDVEKGFYPVKVSATALNAKSTEITIVTNDPQVKFGFGGDDLTNVELSASWVHLSIGDDGRREFMFQYSEDMAKGNKCYKQNGDYSGDIAGLNSTIWDAGTIAAHGIQCCLE